MMMLGQLAALIGVAIGLLVQTVAIVWFFSKLDSRVTWLENSNKELNSVNPLARLIKIETILEIVQVQQDEQIKRLDGIQAKVSLPKGSPG
jgi:hypothetical protein